MKRIYNLYIVALACLMALACGKEDTEVTTNKIETNEVTNIYDYTAQCTYTVEIDENNLAKCGVCWSTETKPTIDNNKVVGTKKSGKQTITIAGLEDNITYYVRAYATTVLGTFYGNEISFSTNNFSLPTISTNNVSSITTLRAVCESNVTNDGNLRVTARGVCWSTQPNPTINDSKTTDGTGTGTFTSNITGLTENTTYYVRAYATNAKGTVYSEEKSFTTLNSVGGSINGHDWVDLGLPSGIKWATCNVGASQPSLYGNYFAWGETTTKTSYTQSNSVTYGVNISVITGSPIYDAARANWGDTWRMPTKREMEELVNNCTWTWTTQENINGYKVTGPNDNSIFLPAAGFRNGSSLYSLGHGGYYWSSTANSLDYAYNFYLLNTEHYVYWRNRYYGQTVRPVSE